MINVEQRQAEGWVLTDEGSEVVEKGSHEFLVFKAVPPEGLPQAEVKVFYEIDFTRKSKKISKIRRFVAW